MTLHLKYRPDIDGLRAIAILFVIIFHAFPVVLSGGFIGVDVFFVISGYLIAAIIFGNLQNGSFGFAEFYARRIKRIFPALLFVILFVIPAGWLLYLPDEWHVLGKHTYNGLLFLLNINLAQDSGYFEPKMELKPLLHLWSLCIEEQFYLIWPLFTLVLWKYTKRCGLWISALLAVSFIANFALLYRYPSAAFYLPFGRLWELGAGALLSYLTIINRNPAKIINTVLPRYADHINSIRSVIGLTLLCVSAMSMNGDTPFPSFYALFPVLGSMALIDAGHESWVNRWILSNRVMVALGLISYALYLWHWPVLSFAKIIYGLELPPVIAGSCLAIAFAAAIFTYFFVERPLRFSPRITHKVRILLTAWLVLIAVGLCVNFHVVKPRLETPQTVGLIAAAKDWTFPYKHNWKKADHFKSFTVGENKKDYVLLIGDSHIEQYQPRLDKLVTPQSPGIIYATYPGCPPLPGLNRDNPAFHCDAFYAFAMNLAQDKRVKTIVVGAYWEKYFDKAYGTTEQNSVYAVGDLHQKILSMNDPVTQASFAALARDLHRTGKKIFILLSNPASPSFDPKYMLQRVTGVLINKPVDKIAFLKTAQASRDTIRKIAAEIPATVIDPMASLCNATACPSMSAKGEPLYSDGDHLRAGYVAKHATFIDQVMR